jgi:hypothetical protein
VARIIIRGADVQLIPYFFLRRGLFERIAFSPEKSQLVQNRKIFNRDRGTGFLFSTDPWILITISGKPDNGSTIPVQNPTGFLHSGQNPDPGPQTTGST